MRYSYISGLGKCILVCLAFKIRNINSLLLTKTYKAAIVI